jgi:hypothetical protein
MEAAMKLIIYGLAAVATSAAVPPVVDYVTRPNDDAVGTVLRGYGLLPIKLPSTLMSVGSLYYVDSSVREFTAICHAEKSDLDPFVRVGRSQELQEILERNGQFSTGVKVDLGPQIKGGVDSNYVARVRASLTDVGLDEIPLGPTSLIFTKLMNNRSCNEMAMRYLYAGGYVCQGQRTLRATVEFKLDNDSQFKLASAASTTTADVKDVVKLAIESQGNQSVVSKEGRLLSGKELTYGVTMTPLCLAPRNARFERVLPHNAYGRLKNYILFNFIEPMLPVKPDQEEISHASDQSALTQ